MTTATKSRARARTKQIEAVADMKLMMFFVGKDIRAMRQMLGESLADFGERFGVQRMAVSRWERDLSRPSYQYMEKLNRLAVEIGYLKGKQLAAAKS